MPAAVHLLEGDTRERTYVAGQHPPCRRRARRPGRGRRDQRLHVTAWRSSLAAGRHRPARRSAPIDPQKWQDQQAMTWDDYHPIPGVNWAESTVAPARALRVALVAIDFPDQPFVATMAKKSDLFGNPQVDPVRREDVPRFYADFFGKPGAVNHGHTINGLLDGADARQGGHPEDRRVRPLPDAAQASTSTGWASGARKAAARPASPATGGWSPMPTRSGRRTRARTSRRTTTSSCASTPATTKPACGRNSAR